MKQLFIALDVNKNVSIIIYIILFTLIIMYHSVHYNSHKSPLMHFVEQLTILLICKSVTSYLIKILNSKQLNTQS